MTDITSLLAQLDALEKASKDQTQPRYAFHEFTIALRNNYPRLRDIVQRAVEYVDQVTADPVLARYDLQVAARAALVAAVRGEEQLTALALGGKHD